MVIGIIFQGEGIDLEKVAADEAVGRHEVDLERVEWQSGACLSTLIELDGEDVGVGWGYEVSECLLRSVHRGDLDSVSESLSTDWITKSSSFSVIEVQYGLTMLVM